MAYLRKGTAFYPSTVTTGALGSGISFPAGHIVKYEPVTTTPVAVQGTDTSYTDLTGSSVSYTPATGASHVVYEYLTTLQGDGIDVNQIQLMKFYYDGSMVANTNWTPLVNIGDDVHSAGYLTCRHILTAWSGAKTMSVKYRCYSSSYEMKYHYTNYSGEGSGTDVYTKIYQITYSVM